LRQFLSESVRRAENRIVAGNKKNPAAPIRTLITHLVTGETKGGWQQCQLQHSCGGFIFLNDE